MTDRLVQNVSWGEQGLWIYFLYGHETNLYPGKKDKKCDAKGMFESENRFEP